MFAKMNSEIDALKGKKICGRFLFIRNEFDYTSIHISANLWYATEVICKPDTTTIICLHTMVGPIPAIGQTGCAAN